MMNELHTTLQRLLHEAGQIAPRDVDVRFEAPTRAWTDTLTLPTVDFFLFHLQENTELRQTGLRTTRGDGSAVKRMRPRCYDCYYMVSVLTTSIVDEHLLLWRTLTTLMKHPQLPEEMLSERLRAADPPLTARVGQGDEDVQLLDVWSALGTPPRPALLYVVTVPVDLDIAFEAPLVLTRSVRYARHGSTSGDGDVLDAEARTHIGGTVRDGAGTPLSEVRVEIEGRAAEGSVTDEEGRFRLAGVSSGEVTLRIRRGEEASETVTVTVPSDAYDITVG